MQCSFWVSSVQAARVGGRSTTTDWMCPVQTHLVRETFYPNGGFCAGNNAFQPRSKTQAAALQTHCSLLTPLIWLKANKCINKPPHPIGTIQWKFPFFSVSRYHQLFVQRQAVVFKNPVLIFYRTLYLLS